MRFRLYIDEVGNADIKATLKETQHYLSLTGVAVSLDESRDRLAPELKSLKARHFDSHPDEPVVLHRNDIVRRKGPFAALRDQIAKDADDTVPGRTNKKRVTA